MENLIVLAWLGELLGAAGKPALMLAGNLVAGAVQKHLVHKLPNDAIPYVNTALSTGALMLTGDSPGEASVMGAGAAMFAKLVQTAGKRGIERSKRRRYG